MKKSTITFFQITRYGFTLIELLVSVAILSILALMALDNFLEATIRTKVARTKSDMRTIVTGLELYQMDHNHYISFVDSSPGALYDRVIVPMTKRLSPITTPVSYLNTVPVDIFETLTTTDGSPLIFFDTYDYVDVEGLRNVHSTKGAGAASGGWWRLSSSGPDRIQAYGGDIARIGEISHTNRMGVDYDPTNGVISAGDIVAVGPPCEEGEAPAIRRTHGYEELFHAKGD